MNNNTLENYYKKAVKNKYEEVKDGDNFIYLNPPTRAKLNKFCWEIFETNKMHSDDLIALNSLLGLPFDLNGKNKFRQQTNQFRPIETFFKGETDPEKIDVVDLAAILVDFQPRPFSKFRKQIDKEDLELIKELRDNNFSINKMSNNSLNDEIENGSDLINEETISNSLNEEEVKEEEVKTVEEKKIADQSKFKKIHFLAVGLIVLCIAAIVYFAFPNKQCMQWSQDHYELVDCDSNVQGFTTLNTVEVLDPNLINLKKINVSDTTLCFDKNGNAIIWYAKTDKGVDYFNTHGRHPENGKSLKPVTQYILDKYKK